VTTPAGRRHAEGRAKPTRTSSTTSRSRSHRAGPVLRRGWQAHHRVAAGLLPQGGASRSTLARRFLKRWKARPQAGLLEELREQGVFFDELPTRWARSRPFDLVCHVAFDQPPLTRKERAEQRQEAQLLHQVRRAGPGRARGAARQVRRRAGIDDIETLEILKVEPLTPLGTPIEIIKLSAASRPTSPAVRELEDELYKRLGVGRKP
jgi:hypothetical protein